jgi:hypothetical protein
MAGGYLKSMNETREEVVFLTAHTQDRKSELAERIFDALARDMKRYPDEYQGGLYIYVE